MLNDIFIFALALVMVIKGATLATTYATRLARNFRLSEYAVGFTVIAIISILPETIIAIESALSGMPAFGLGTLFGSNVADLTLILALVVLAVGRGLKAESRILKNAHFYPFVLLLPIVLGVDGSYSRLDGIALIVSGVIFYFLAVRHDRDTVVRHHKGEGMAKNIAFLLLGMALLLVGAHFTIHSATALALLFGVSPVIIGMLVVALGTTIPELFFAIESAQKGDDSLAIGDILGTVLADATVVVGIIAVIAPFSFPLHIIYVTGGFMLGAAILLFYYLKTGRMLAKREAWLLIVFWFVFVLAELWTNLP